MAVRHTIRANGSGKMKEVELTPLKAIRFFCQECMGFKKHEVRRCNSHFCPLFPFRSKGLSKERKKSTKNGAFGNENQRTGLKAGGR